MMIDNSLPDSATGSRLTIYLWTGTIASREWIVIHCKSWLVNEEWAHPPGHNCNFFWVKQRSYRHKAGETIYNFEYPLTSTLLPIYIELVIVSNIFVAMLYLCTRTRIKGQWGQWRWELKKLAQYAMIPVITLHYIIRESSSSPGGTTVMSQIRLRDRAYTAPSPLAFILRMRKIQSCSLIIAPWMMFLLSRRHY